MRLPYLPTGKYWRGQPAPERDRLGSGGQSAKMLSDQNLSRVEALLQFAPARGHTLLERAVSWLLTRLAVASVIAGPTSPQQVRTNAVATGWRLTGAELAQIDAIVPPPG
jgi:aryl-alcohol dehydrogenase-like predicted oxidoreductase